MSLINLRGTNGSGKTYCVTEGLLRPYGFSYLCRDDRGLGEEVVATVVPELNLACAGLYREGLGTGGCDWYLGKNRSTDELEQLLEDLHSTGRVVLYEGFMVSGTIARWSALAQRIPTKFVFLDTPLEVCVEHILERRRRRGNDRPFDPSNVKALHRQTENTFAALKRDGHDVEQIDYKRGPQILHDIVKGMAP